MLPLKTITDRVRTGAPSSAPFDPRSWQAFDDGVEEIILYSSMAHALAIVLKLSKLMSQIWYDGYKLAVGRKTEEHLTSFKLLLD